MFRLATRLAPRRLPGTIRPLPQNRRISTFHMDNSLRGRLQPLMSGIKIISGLATLVILGSASFYIYINHHLETTYPVSPLITEPSTRKLLRGAALREHVAPDPSIAYLFLLKALEEIHATGELAEESPEVQELVVRLARAALGAGEGEAAEGLLWRAWGMVVDGRGVAVRHPVVVGKGVVEYTGEWRDAQIARVADTLAPMLVSRGEYDRALRVYGAALQAAKRREQEQEQEDGDLMRLRQINLVTSLGEVFALKGDTETAKALFGSALADVKKHGGDGGWLCLDAVLMYNLAQVAERVREVEESGAWANSALAVVREHGDVRACVNCETHVVRLMGRLAEKRGELEEALGLYQKSLELARQSGTGNIEETKDAVAKIEEKIAAVE